MKRFFALLFAVFLLTTSVMASSPVELGAFYEKYKDYTPPPAPPTPTPGAFYRKWANADQSDVDSADIDEDLVNDLNGVLREMRGWDEPSPTPVPTPFRTPAPTPTPTPSRAEQLLSSWSEREIVFGAVILVAAVSLVLLATRRDEAERNRHD